MKMEKTTSLKNNLVAILELVASARNKYVID